MLAPLLLGCELLDSGGGGEARAEREAAPTPEYVIDIAALDLPREPPFIGGPGIDEFGYPLAQPDQLALLNLLRLGRFELLDRFVTHYQAEFEADPRKEYWPDQALAAFFTNEPQIGERIREWQRALPDSFAAAAAVANYEFQTALRTRDAAALAQAAAGFEAVLVERPGYIAARRRLIQIAWFQRDATAERAQLDAAMASCPSCYIPQAYYVMQRTPGLGGSVAATKAYLDAIAGQIEQHPKWGSLAGFLAWDECSRLSETDHPRDGLPACEEALRHGDDERFVITTGFLLSRADDCPAALPYFDRGPCCTRTGSTSASSAG